MLNTIYFDNVSCFCKGLCKRFENTVRRGSYNNIDENGNPMKNCKECEYFCFYTELFCPCCGFKYATRPASKKKKYYRELESATATKQESQTSISPISLQ